MKNIRKLLIGLGLLFLSGNAAAIMIAGTVDAVSKKMDLSMEEIAGLLDDYQPETKKQSKHLKKANKKFNKLSGFLLKMTAADLSDKKAAKKARKQSKKEQKLASLLDKMGLDLTAFLVAGDPVPAVTTTGGGETEGDTKRVPEPSTIALLGIGLAGFAAARRLKQQS
jgi:hypothetical protein